MNLSSTNNTPNSKFIIPHFLIGSIIWLLVLFLLAIEPKLIHEHYFNGKLLAITHLLVLGFICVIIFGAIHQLVPVIFKCNLFNEKLIPIILSFLLSGTLLMFISFWLFFEMNLLLFIGGLLVLISSLIFIIQIWLTSNLSNEKSIDKWFIKISSIWFLITIIIGLSIALHFLKPYLEKSHLEILKIHAHIGIIGWFLQLIIGVSANLLPMFLLSHNFNKNTLKISFILINISLIFGSISHFYNFNNATLVFIILGIIGIFSYFIFIIDIYKKRIKKKLDIGMKITMISFIFLIIPICLNLIISFYKNQDIHFSISYIIALLIGFITTLIIGQTFKTLPFIVWLKEYKNVVGKEKTILPKDLYSEKILNFILYSHNIGFCVLLIGLLSEIFLISQIGIYILIFSAILYLVNVSKITFHKRKKV